MINRNLDFLQQRNSIAQLDNPCPSADELSEIFKAAARAPDHARLRPWRFIVFDGDSRDSLGDLFVQASAHDNDELSIEQMEKIRQKPLRAPLIITVIACLSEHPKVPAIEQHLSAGCAAHNILLAAEALGYGSIWRTGSMAFHPVVKKGLGLVESEEIVGFIYLGTPQSGKKKLPDIDIDDFVSYWS